MHLNYLGPLGGGLRGTLPNPKVAGEEASLVISRAVFGRKPGVASSLWNANALGAMSTSGGGKDREVRALVVSVPAVTPDPDSAKVSVAYAAGVLTVSIAFECEAPREAGV